MLRTEECDKTQIQIREQLYRHSFTAMAKSAVVTVSATNLPYIHMASELLES